MVKKIRGIINKDTSTPLPGNRRHPGQCQAANVMNPRGIPSLNPSNQAAARLCLQPHPAISDCKFQAAIETHPARILLWTRRRQMHQCKIRRNLFFSFSFFVPRLDCSPCGLINSAPILLNFPQRTTCFLGWRGIFALHWMDGGEDAFVCGSVSQIIWDRRFFFLVAVRFGISPRDGGMQGTSLSFLTTHPMSASAKVRGYKNMCHGEGVI